MDVQRLKDQPALLDQVCHFITLTHTHHHHSFIAAYQAEKVNPLQESKAPAYSFGLKTGLLQTKNTTPSPNAYTLPSVIGSNIVGKRSNAAFSMTGRSKIGSFHEDLRRV